MDSGGLELRPRLLAQFVCLVDHGDLRSAAAELALTPRALSRAVRELEHTAREPLLAPGARALQLTPAGERLARTARRALAALERFDRLAHEDHDTVRVAHVPGSATLSPKRGGFQAVRAAGNTSVPGLERLGGDRSRQSFSAAL